MDLRVPEQEKAFREEVRTFLEESLTPEIREAGKMVTSVFAPVKEAMAWQKILNDKGWAAPHWPKEHGGTGWSVTQRAIFAEELVRAETPPLVPMGLHMCGPCLIGCGTEEQQKEYLPISSIWCWTWVPVMPTASIVNFGKGWCTPASTWRSVSAMMMSRKAVMRMR